MVVICDRNLKSIQTNNSFIELLGEDGASVKEKFLKEVSIRYI